jgi:hypothetical protein
MPVVTNASELMWGAGAIARQGEKSKGKGLAQRALAVSGLSGQQLGACQKI